MRCVNRPRARLDQRFEIGAALGQGGALGVEAVDRVGGPVPRSNRIARPAFSIRGGNAGGVGRAAEVFYCRRRRITRRDCSCNDLFQTRENSLELAQTVSADQAFGGRRATVGGHEPVPPPHQPGASHQPLPDGQRLPLVALGNPDLRQPPRELGWGGGKARQRLQSRRELRIARDRLAPDPPPRALTAKRGVEIIAQRRRERALIPRLGGHRDRPATALRQCIGQRLAFGCRRRQRRARRRQITFRAIAPLGGQSAASVSGLKRFLRSSQRNCRLVRRIFCSDLRGLMLRAIAERRHLRLDLRRIVRRPRCLRLGCFKRSLCHPPLGAHCRLTRQQPGQLCLGATRHNLRRVDVGRQPRRLRLAIAQSRRNRRLLGFQRRNRPHRVVAQRLLARGLAGLCRFEPIKLGQAPHHSVAPCPRRRQLMRQTPPRIARFDQRRSPHAELGRRRFLPRLDLAH